MEGCPTCDSTVKKREGVTERDCVRQRKKRMRMKDPQKKKIKEG